MHNTVKLVARAAVTLSQDVREGAMVSRSFSPRASAQQRRAVTRPIPGYEFSGSGRLRR